MRENVRGTGNHDVSENIHEKVEKYKFLVVSMYCATLHRKLIDYFLARKSGDRGSIFAYTECVVKMNKNHSNLQIKKEPRL